MTVSEHIIERRAEIELVCDHVSASISREGGANVLFVTGEAGIGKSTLLMAVRRRIASLADAPVVACAECSTPLAGQDIGEVEALEPWAQLIAQLASGERQHDTRRLVGELARAWIRVIPVVGDVLESVVDTAQIIRQHGSHAGGESQRSAASQQQIFQQYVNVLSELSERTPIVLMIDDFHWADTSSTNLLFAAARQLQGKPVLFIIAYRPDDAANSRAGEGHPLLHVRNELERYSLASEVGVPGMDAGDLDALLRERYPSYRNDDRFEEWLARIGGGNALFITRFLDTLEEDGYIDRRSGSISEGFEEIRVPASAQAVIRERTRRFDEETRDLLRYASVEGETFTSAVLARLTETPTLKLLQKLRHVENLHQAVRSLGKLRVYAGESSAYQFTHALLHKELYEGLGEEEREILHRMVLDVLRGEWELVRQSEVDLPRIAARLAVHAGVVGENLFGAEVLIEGARSSWKGYAEQETLRMLDGAMRLLARVSSPTRGAERDRLVATVHLIRSQVHYVYGRPDRAVEEAHSAESTFRTLGLTERFVDALNKQAEGWQCQDIDRSEKIANAALEEARGAGYAKGELDALNILCKIDYTHGRFDEVLEAYEEMLEIVRGNGLDSRHESLILNNIGIIRQKLGDLDMAMECFDRSLDLIRERNDPIMEAGVLVNLGSLHQSTGRYDDARRTLAACREICRATGDEWTGAYCAVNLGNLECELKHYQEALREFEVCLETARRVGDRIIEAQALASMGDTFALLGELEPARDHQYRALQIFESLGSTVGIATTCLTLGNLHRTSGDSVRARESYELALSIARQTGLKFTEAMTLGRLALLERDEAGHAGPSGRISKLNLTLGLLQACVDMYRELQHREYEEQWGEELESVRSELQALEAEPRQGEKGITSEGGRG